MLTNVTEQLMEQVLVDGVRVLILFEEGVYGSREIRMLPTGLNAVPEVLKQLRLIGYRCVQYARSVC